MKVLVGSKNPVKIEAVKEAFSKYYNSPEVICYDTNSGVPSQPVDIETFEGARNRTSALREINTQNNLNADYFIGIEGGILKIFDKWFALGLMCILNKAGLAGYGTSPMFELPDFVIEKLLTGNELGKVMDEITGDENTKQKGGAIGFFTNGIMDRKELYVGGLIAALVPFNHEQLFFNGIKPDNR